MGKGNRDSMTERHRPSKHAGFTEAHNDYVFEKLNGMTYHEGLGTMADKVDRITFLSIEIAKMHNENEAKVIEIL